LIMNKIGSLQAFMFYLIQYSLMANIFFIILVIGYYLKESVKLLYKESENSPLQFINQLKGYYNINPIMSLSLAISLSLSLFLFLFLSLSNKQTNKQKQNFHLGGIRRIVGLFSKKSVLLSVLLNGYYFLSIVAVLFNRVMLSRVVILGPYLQIDEGKFLNLGKLFPLILILVVVVIVVDLLLSKMFKKR